MGLQFNDEISRGGKGKGQSVKVDHAANLSSLNMFFFVPERNIYSCVHFPVSHFHLSPAFLPSFLWLVETVESVNNTNIFPLTGTGVASACVNYLILMTFIMHTQAGTGGGGGEGGGAAHMNMHTDWKV